MSSASPPPGGGKVNWELWILRAVGVGVALYIVPRWVHFLSFLVSNSRRPSREEQQLVLRSLSILEDHARSKEASITHQITLEELGGIDEQDTAAGVEPVSGAREMPMAPFWTSGSSALSSAEVELYGRQLILPQLGVAGQVRLKESSVLVVGAGGLGSPVCLYLAAAGIGRLGIMDGDAVAMTNLHRQVIHNAARCGTNKAISAKQTCQHLNKQIRIDAHDTPLTPSVAERVVPQYDVLVDCTDNPAARYLLNDAAVLFNKPVVCGSALRWEGQLWVYNYRSGPCYRCLHPQPPHRLDQSGPEGLFNALSPGGGACDMEGVIGTAPGTIGVMQAMEVLKVCGGLGDHSIGASNRMVMYDGLDAEGPFRSIRLRTKRPTCAVCGDHPSISSLQDSPDDYIDMCPADLLPPLPPSAHVKPSQLASHLHRHPPSEANLSAPPRVPPILQDDNTYQQQVGGGDGGLGAVSVVDVRPSAHYAVSHVRHSLNLPIDQILSQSKEELLARLRGPRGNNRGAPPSPVSYVVVCRRGNDSRLAVSKLRDLFQEEADDDQGGGGEGGEGREEKGCTFLNLQGGLEAVRRNVEPTEAMPLV
ncbi:unnamed protein product [Vitrella brassicaformis CCMP3155]|uniref:Rhodanese domain-containing protein n=4 Tax=Vitrella brassicaformis TaxID=1169539 RepID=A0A0G4EEQ3_VITBC|nr:unnamed protein product [Vitrella brassicaformis CCMP3155]|eukprot:CEL94027.1 unnamed protein product [Vitrella brassicaformis CCMP3155]